ncbi:MAG: hypothetical protein ACT4O3_08295, partial [Elusimicrobiota bacterium]
MKPDSLHRRLPILPARLLKRLAAPLPHTPPLSKYAPSLAAVKRAASVSLALVVFHAQVVCAGIGTLPQLPSTFRTPTLVERLKKWTNESGEVLGLVFHASEWEDRNKLLDPGSSAGSIQRQEARQKARMEIEQQNIQNTGLQLPTVRRPGQDNVSQSLGEIKSIDQGFLPGEAVSAEIQAEIEAVRRQMKSLAAAGAEFKYMPKKNFDGTLQITYFIDGQASRIMNQRSRNAHGHLLIRNVTEMKYDLSDLLVSTTEESWDAKGQRTVSRREFEYHAGAKFHDSSSQKVETLRETVTTPTGAEKTTVREDMKYDDQGNLSQFVEKAVDENGRLTERWWWGASYDGDKNLTSYKEISRTNGMDTYVAWRADGYEQNSHWTGPPAGSEDENANDEFGRSRWLLTGYSRDIRNGDGTTQKDRWTGLSYDEFGNLASYTRLATDFQGLDAVTRWSGSYDEFDRVIGYEQTVTDAFGHRQDVRLSGVEYSLTDDMLAYVETTTENGQTRTREVSNAAYDAKRNLIRSREVVTDSGGRRTVKDFSVPNEEGMGYNAQGRLEGYREVVYLEGLTIERNITGVTYDVAGRRSGGVEVTRTRGRLPDGTATDVVLRVETRRDQEQLYESSDVLNAGLGAVFQIRYVQGFQETRSTRGWDAASSALIRDLKEITLRDGITPQGGYHEVRTTGDPAGSAYASTVETWRTGGVLDGMGRLMNFTEVTIQNGRPQTRSTRVVTGLAYDMEGRNTASHEEITDSLGTTTTVDRRNMQYDILDRLTGYAMETVTEGEGIRRESTVVRSDIQYNGLGDVAGYRERVTRGDSVLVEDVQWTGSYNLYGQIAASRQTTRRTGTSNGETMDVTETVDTRRLQYNLDGTLKGFTEEMVSSAAPDRMVITVLENAQYDDAGRMASFRQTRHEVSAASVSHTASGAFIIAGDAPLHAVSVVERVSTSYNSLGLATAYNEIITENGLQIINGVSNIRYDSQGRMTGSVSASRVNGDEPRTVYMRDGVRLDAWQLAALLGTSGKTMEDLIEDGTLTVSTQMGGSDQWPTTVRDGVVYDDFGRVLEATDTTAYPDGFQTVQRARDMRYDSLGRLLSSVSETHQSGAAVELVYRLNGSVVSLPELDAVMESTGLSLWDLMQGVHSDYRLTAGAEPSANPVFEKVNTVVRTDIRYNGYGQTLGYRESTSDPDNGVVSQTSAVEISYNRRGKVDVQRSENHTVYDTGTVSDTRTVMTYFYDAGGLLLGAEGNGATVSTETAQWTDTNQDGTVDTLIPAQDTTTEFHQVYGAFGGQPQLLYQTSRSNSTTLDGSTTRSASTTFYTYSPAGRLVGAASQGRSVHRDVWGVSTTTDTSQLLTSIQGELKVVLAASDAAMVNILDGSSSRSRNTIQYFYDERGVGTHGTGLGTSLANNGFGEATRERTSQTYEFIAGQFRLVLSEVISSTQEELEEPGGPAPPASATASGGVLGNLVQAIQNGVLDNWQQTLAGLPFIVTFGVYQQIFQALAHVLNFSLTELLFGASSPPPAQNPLAAAVQQAMARLAAEGHALELTSVQIISGTPSQAGVVDTASFITWSADGVVLIHQDVLAAWAAQGRNVADDIYLTLLHENHEYAGYRQAQAAGQAITWELLQGLSDQAVALGYMPAGIQQNWSATPPLLASSSQFGTVEWSGILAQLSDLPGAAGRIDQAFLDNVETFLSRVNKNFDPAQHGFALQRDMGSYAIWKSADGLHTWIAYREDLNPANKDEDPGNDGEPSWSTVTFVHMAKTADGRMHYRSTFNLGSSQDAGAGYTIEWRSPSDPSMFARLSNVLDKDGNRAVNLMVKAGEGADRVVGQRSWYEGRRQTGVDAAGEKIYDRIRSSSVLYRIGDMLTKQSLTVAEDGYVTFGTLSKNLSTGALFGTISGEINISSDPAVPQYVRDAVRVFNNGGRYDYRWTDGGWTFVQARDSSQNALAENAAFRPVGGPADFSIGGARVVRDDNGVTITNPDGGASRGGSNGELSRQRNGVWSSSLYGSVSWQGMLNALNPLQSQGRGAILSLWRELSPSAASAGLEAFAGRMAGAIFDNWQALAGFFESVGVSAISAITPSSPEGAVSALRAALAEIGLADPAVAGLTAEGLLQMLGVTGSLISARVQGSAVAFAAAGDGLQIEGTLAAQVQGTSQTVSLAAEMESSYTGAVTRQNITVTYQYDEKGRLVSASGGGTSVSDDGFGNVTTSRLSQNFIIINGQAKLREVETASHTVNADGSESWMDGTRGSESLRVAYSYDTSTGLLREGAGRAAVGRGVSVSWDPFGTRTVSRTEQHFTAVNGQAKMSRSLAASFTEGMDGTTTYMGWADESGVVRGQAMEVLYNYDANGLLAAGPGAAGRGYGESYSLDAFGNSVSSRTEQFYTAVRNQAKLGFVTTSSFSRSADGSVTVTDPYTLAYRYSARGLLEGASLAGRQEMERAGAPSGVLAWGEVPFIHSITTDPFGNATESWADQRFAAIAGQSKLVESVSWSVSLSVDGSTTRTEPYAVTYRYAADDAENRRLRRAGALEGASLLSPIHARTVDAFGNVSDTWTDQVFVIVAGQAKISRSTSWSESRQTDGSVSITRPYAIVHSYYEDTDENRAARRVGSLEGAALEEPIESVTTDVFGNVTRSRALQVFTVRAGQAKLASVTSWSDSISADGASTVTSPYTIVYTYSAAGRLEKAELQGRVDSTTTDAFGNVTESHSEQAFRIIAGQAKMTSVTSWSESRQTDGSVSETGRYTVDYVYHGEEGENVALRRVGLLAGAEMKGPILTRTTDAFQGVTNSSSFQTFTVLGGQARVLTVESSSRSESVDGSVTVTDPYVLFNLYGEDTPENREAGLAGRLLGAEIVSPEAAGFVPGYRIRSVTTDAFGNVTESLSNQTFAVAGGQARLGTATSASRTVSTDGSVTVTDPYTIEYRYDRGGRLAGAEIVSDEFQSFASGFRIRSVTTDPFGSATETLSNQTFIILGGQARLSAVTTASRTDSDDGSFTITDPYATLYTYFEDSSDNRAAGLVGRLQKVDVLRAPPAARPVAGASVPESFTEQNLLDGLGVDGRVLSFTRTAAGITFRVERSDGVVVDGSVSFSHRLVRADGTSSESFTIFSSYQDEGVLVTGDHVLTQSYDSQGRLASASGVQTVRTDDGRGNTSLTRSDQIFAAVDGRLLLTAEEVVFGASGSDGSVLVNDPYTVRYAYGAAGELKAVSVEGDYIAADGVSYPIHATSTDAFGNVTQSWSRQSFIVMNNQAKLAGVTTRTETLGSDGSRTVTDAYRVNYTYNDRGELATAVMTTPIHSVTTDDFG